MPPKKATKKGAVTSAKAVPKTLSIAQRVALKNKNKKPLAADDDKGKPKVAKKAVPPKKKAPPQKKAVKKAPPKPARKVAKQPTGKQARSNKGGKPSPKTALKKASPKKAPLKKAAKKASPKKKALPPKKAPSTQKKEAATKKPTPKRAQGTSPILPSSSNDDLQQSSGPDNRVPSPTSTASPPHASAPDVASIPLVAPQSSSDRPTMPSCVMPEPRTSATSPHNLPRDAPIVARPQHSGGAMLLPRRPPPSTTTQSNNTPLSPKHRSATAADDDDVFVMSPMWHKASAEVEDTAARSSALLISRAAAQKPMPSPQTMWISLSSDDEDEAATSTDHPPQAGSSTMAEQRRGISMELDFSRCHSESSASGGHLDGSGAPSPGAVVPPPTSSAMTALTQTTQMLPSPPPSTVLMRDVLPPTFRARKAHEGIVRHPPPPGAHVVDVDADDGDGTVDATQRLDHSPSHKRHMSAVAYVAKHSNPSASSQSLTHLMPPKRDRMGAWKAPGSVALPIPAAQTAASQLGAKSPTSFFTPNKYSDKRPVEVLRPLFPKTFTKAGFLDMATKVVSAAHCLQHAEFWDAFRSVSYVGEGSFGLVWKCVTLDGDEVAVKSCPISFHCPEAIDDGFSVLREIAVMRFLNEQNVPYVLPLHNAFFVQATEALPPTVMEAVCMHSKVHVEQQRRRRKRGIKKDAASLALETVAREVLSVDEHKLYLETKLPKFLAISQQDALECDATLFLVTELCDGDVEGIERSETVSRGVAYCVSSALVDLHRLGLVHLDLKPSNILYAYERGAAPASAAGHHHAASSAIKFYLSDFGNCHIVGPSYKDDIHDAVGTYEYMDTKALEKKVCSRATDCFSLGCTLYELLMCARLYEPCRSRECGEDHTRGCFVAQSRGPFLIPSTGVLHKVTELLLATDPLRRLTAAGCLSYLVNALGITSHHEAAATTSSGRHGTAASLFPDHMDKGEQKVSSSVKKRFASAALANGGAPQLLSMASVGMTPQRVHFATPHASSRASGNQT